jgi:NTP pyrophosphatase (non-canonical NTP hydrolase)
MRHGYSSHHPQRTETNRDDLQEELGHVLWAMQLLIGAKDLTSTAIFDSKVRKAERLTNYLHWQD